MGRDHEHQGSDLFSSAASSPETSSPSPERQVTSLPRPEQRHVLPKDLPNAVKNLSDDELDRLLAAALEETKRGGKMVPNVQPNDPVPPRPTSQRKAEAAATSLTRGQISAVRAAFKAGVKPSAIARQFGISQSDIRKVLSDMKA
jgi:hypothetical protein